uniref:Beta-trefoil DNA-binding domain-containing protein n=1 Tax=Panagrolaimus sp. ES5 TaxID=591445 RepID=A0AC34FMM6_9BILA
MERMEKSTVNIPDIVAIFRARGLYISSNESKKFCRLSINLHISESQTIENINTGRIKVISKPSKKSQKDTGNDGILTTFKNGSQIALYNRYRQANSTRYLHCHSNKFFGSITQWSVFKIYLVDEDANDDTLIFETTDESICYKSKVKLVDIATEMSLPIMRIRKVAKESKEDIYKPMDKDNEPVSQLHMIAFEHIDNNGRLSYLSISDLNAGINEGARWTITSAKRYVYRFYPVNGLKKISMSSFPVVFEIIKAQNDKIKKLEWLELRGRGFDRSTKVWFNTCQSPQTIYRSAKTLICVIPSTREYLANCTSLGIPIINNETVPLYLTNEDGNIYPTSFIFIYNNNIQGSLGRAVFVHEQDRNTIVQPVNIRHHHQNNNYPSQMGIIH